MSAHRSYEDFEPISEWVDAEGFRTLLIYLPPGFKKNQIKVQITATNHVKISGERPLDDRRMSRFVKQFPLPEHCKVADIRAMFENGELHVKFPIARVAPSTTMHISPSSPMEKTATELREKKQEGDDKSRKAVAEGEFLQKEQKQPEAKEEVGHKEHPKANGDQEKKQDKEKTEEGRQKQAEAKEEVGHKEHPKANRDQEKKQDKEKSEEGRQKQPEAKEEVGHKEHPKANGDQEKKQDKEKTEEGRSNGEKKQGHQMSPPLKADDTIRQEKETEQPKSIGSEMMAKYSINNLLMELTPDKKILLVNVAVSALLFLGIGLYIMYKRGDE